MLSFELCTATVSSPFNISRVNLRLSETASCKLVFALVWYMLRFVYTIHQRLWAQLLELGSERRNSDQDIVHSLYEHRNPNNSAHQS